LEEEDEFYPRLKRTILLFYRFSGFYLQSNPSSFYESAPYEEMLQSPELQTPLDPIVIE